QGHGPVELSEVSSAFNEMASRLEELFEARRELVAWASHDLRTPITALQTALEAVEDGVVNAAHYLPAMRENVRTLRRLVDDLFEVAQLDSANVTLDLEEMPVAPVVEASVDGLRSEAAARRIVLETHVGAALPDVRIAPDKVQRVLQNVLTNALRATPAGASIAVVVGSSDGQVVVAVEDPGVGIPDGQEERVFDRFWRG